VSADHAHHDHDHDVAGRRWGNHHYHRVTATELYATEL
jgi:hypothetical protein